LYLYHQPCTRYEGEVTEEDYDSGHYDDWAAYKTVESLMEHCDINKEDGDEIIEVKVIRRGTIGINWN